VATLAEPTKKPAVEVCNHFKKVLTAHRLYSRGHGNLDDAIAALEAAIASYSNGEEDLELEIGPLQLSSEGQVVYRAESRDDSIAHPLFLDGIQRIAFSPSVARDELARFLEIWSGAWESAAVSSHTLATRFWEADFRSIRMVMLETFAEGSEVESRGDAKKKQDEVKALIEQISSERLAGGSAGELARPKVLRLSPEDLAILRMRAVNEITSEELERQDKSTRALVSGPSDEELGRLIGEVTSPEGVEDRVIRALTLSASQVSHAQRESVREIVGSILASLAARGELGRVASIAEERSGEASIIVRALATAEVIAPLIAALDDPRALALSVRILDRLDQIATRELLDRLEVVRSPEGRKALSRVIANLHPSGDELAARLDRGPEVAKEILAIAASYSAGDALPLKRAALMHELPEVRRLAIAEIKSPDPALRTELLCLLTDADPTTRRAALKLFVRARDPEAAAILAGSLAEGVEDPAERPAVLVALGVLGGKDAIAALRREIEAQRNPELVASALLALAQAEGESARPLLKSFSQKLLVRKRVKEAALEALRRLDQRAATPQAPAPATSTPPVAQSRVEPAPELRSQEDAKAIQVKAFSAYRQGMHAQYSGDLSRASQAFREAADLAPEHAEYSKMAGKTAFEAGELGWARRYLDIASRLRPDDPEVSGLLTDLEKRSGR
jgi:hypothetical protein